MKIDLLDFNLGYQVKKMRPCAEMPLHLAPPLGIELNRIHIDVAFLDVPRLFSGNAVALGGSVWCNFGFGRVSTSAKGRLRLQIGHMNE